MEKADLITHRSFDPSDENFIFATWLKGLRWGNHFFERIEETIYFENYRRLLRMLLPLSKITLAVLKDSPDVIIGYSVTDGPRVHWIHVKENWRKMGIAKDLLPQGFDSYSHFSDLGYEIMKKYPKIIFNPFLN